jgi:hypothetical protein
MVAIARERIILTLMTTCSRAIQQVNCYCADQKVCQVCIMMSKESRSNIG